MLSSLRSREMKFSKVPCIVKLRWNRLGKDEANKLPGEEELHTGDLLFLAEFKEPFSCHVWKIVNNQFYSWIMSDVILEEVKIGEKGENDN